MSMKKLLLFDLIFNIAVWRISMFIDIKSTN